MRKIVNLPLFIKEQELLQNNSCFYYPYIIERDLHHNISLINEKHGTFDGQIELVNNLCEVIVTKLQNIDLKDSVITLTRSDIEKWNTDKTKILIFFNELTIIFKENYGAIASYIPEKSKYNNECSCFENVVICIDIDLIDTYPNLITALIHELTHAYEDFKKNEKGLDWTLDKLSKDKTYIKICHNIETSKTSLDRAISTMFYILNNSEKNAFISEFSSILDGYFEKETVISYNDALFYFKQKDVYKVVIKCIALLNDVNLYEYITSQYNDTYNTNLSKAKCIKLLKSKITKMFNKIVETLPKIYFDWLEKKQIKENQGTLKHLTITNNFIR